MNPQAPTPVLDRLSALLCRMERRDGFACTLEQAREWLIEAGKNADSVRLAARMSLFGLSNSYRSYKDACSLISEVS